MRRALFALVLALAAPFAFAIQSGEVATQSYNLTATGNVGTASQDYCLLGFFVNSTNVGTLVLRKNGSGGTVLDGTITPAAGAFYRFPLYIPGGLHATIGGTALDVTFFVTNGAGGNTCGG